MFLTNFTKGCRSRRGCVLIYYIRKGYFLTGHCEKGYQFQNVENTVFRPFVLLMSPYRFSWTIFIPPVYEVYRGYIVLAFSVCV